MTAFDRRADAESRLRRSLTSLGAARALLNLQPPAYDDAVNRASAAALHAARALVDSQWAKDSQPGWDPEWRPGMPRSYRQAKNSEVWSPDALHRLLDRFAGLAAQMGLPEDFTMYLRTLVEDGLEADTGEAPNYDEDEARHAVRLSTQMIASVAQRLSMGSEFEAAASEWASLYDADNDPPTDPDGLPVRPDAAVAEKAPRS
jgi:hypothetical protein